MFSTPQDLERVLNSLRRETQRIRIAKPAGLFRRKPRSYFHHYPELFIQTGGGTDFECPSESFRLRTWEVGILPAGVPHAESPVNLRTPYGILVFMQARDGIILHRAASTPRNEIVATHTEHLVSSRARTAFRYLEEMSSPVSEKNRTAFQRSLLEVFLITILAELQRPTRRAADPQSPLITEAEKLARALLGNTDLSVANLASSLGCSADYLSRKFHQAHGITLTTWITRERVLMARDLLADPRHSIAEIGWMCGFSSASYFIRIFRQQTNFTPRAWRESVAQ